jgi:predicted esterase
MSEVVLQAGAELDHARGVVVLLHGRGGSARDILSLARELTQDAGIAFLAPQAEDSTWYPLSFLAPREHNEPKLSKALATVDAVVRRAEAAGITRDQVVIAGFSQGACLATEYVASNPARYAGLIAFTGGLIGPLGSDVTKSGDLAGTPAFLGSSDPDPHVPWVRVEESAAQLRAMGAQVELRRYPGKPHSISEDEITAARALIAAAFQNAPAA